jgi:hypothetical protein
VAWGRKKATAWLLAEQLVLLRAWRPCVLHGTALVRVEVSQNNAPMRDWQHDFDFALCTFRVASHKIVASIVREWNHSV